MRCKVVPPPSPRSPQEDVPMTASQPRPTADNSLLHRLGTKPVINACGIYTDLGGSRLSPGVWAAMAEANQTFVRLTELLDTSGAHIARLLGAEAARVTPGAAAAIMLGTAACLAGTDGTKSEQLPDTKGMKSEVLIQAGHRYKYDRQVAMTGAKLIEIGSANGTRADQFEQAIERAHRHGHPPGPSRRQAGHARPRTGRRHRAQARRAGLRRCGLYELSDRSDGGISEARRRHGRHQRQIFRRPQCRRIHPGAQGSDPGRSPMCISPATNPANT